LIYVPLLNGTGELFEIKFTNQTKDFFMLGRKIPYFYELELEKFKYSQEHIDTVFLILINVVDQSSYAIELQMNTGHGNYMTKEIVYQSPNNTHANATVVGIVSGWHDPSKVLKVTNIAGEFTDNHMIIGATSNARYTLTSFDTLKWILLEMKIMTINILSNQANNIIDFTETNPLWKNIMSTPTYHRVIRKLVIGFGNLFNEIKLVRYNPDNSEAERFLIPIAYATKEKYVMCLEEDLNLE
jgi:hypothetical protein